jgi:phosphatidate cytidylyltransferase
MLAAHTNLKFSTVCVAIFGGLVFPYLLSALVRLRVMENGQFYILVAFLLTMVPDSGAYFAGMAFGKHKLAPIISPKKTVEGAVGGVLATVAAMLLYCLVLQFAFKFKVNYVYAVLYGVLGAGGSILGDLTFSVIKRQTKIKDYGNLLPGHGGILDRFDSTVVVAPLTELLIVLLPFAVK